MDHTATASATATNAAVATLPDHLLQFGVDQRYDQYTPIDHAVWRFIMRQNAFFLREYAHKLYFQGLLNTGISMDRIPRIQEMNDILGRIGWGAMAVDGFIPPAAFMEFQAYRVLVIACDMRQIHHIEYTPAPDIVHEAAGHAPIIVDQEYADYLQRFGEVGAKAMSSKKDFELYEAIRHLSILKELPEVDAAELEAATKLVEERQANLGEPSEMALLSRLHWWTVEYGLIGTVEEPKIYGAGLLSSIGESVSCLEPEVKKIPYSLETQNYAFDITTRQPQLFVTRDFRQLSEVLEQFASTMAFRTGGLSGIQKAIECHNAATCVYSSGLQVSGVFTEVLTGDNAEPIYLRTSGPTALAFADEQLSGHGTERHRDGFGSPIGRVKGIAAPLERLSEDELVAAGIALGKAVTLEFESGIRLRGTLEEVVRRDERNLLFTFADCRVTYGETVLFDPAWGAYDMAVGEKIVSVFNGAADKSAYQQVALVPKERTIKVPPSEETKRLGELYRQVREIRDQQSGYDNLETIWRAQQLNHAGDWLLSLEIFELLKGLGRAPALATEIEKFLHAKAAAEPELATLIEWGFRLVEYHEPPVPAPAQAA